MSAVFGSVRLRDLRPLGTLVRALLTFTAVADVLLALQAWAHRQHPHHYHSAGELALVAFTSLKLLVAVALAVAALYLATRPKRAFQRILLLLAVTAGILGLLAWQPALIVIAIADCLAAVWAASLWPEVGDQRSSQAGWLLLFAATGMTSWLFLLQNPDRRMGFLFTLVLTLAFVAAVSAFVLLDRNPSLPATWDLPAALSVYQAHARSTVAPFALMRDKRHFWGPDRRSFLAFGSRAGTAVVLGPAIGPPGTAIGLHDEFRSACRRRGWRPAFYQVSEMTARAMPGTRRVGVGSEALVDVDRFGLEGPEVAKLRRDIARARREEVVVQVVPEAELTPELRSQTQSLNKQTHRHHRLGEMSFSVGRAGDPPMDRMVGLVHDRDGRMVGYVTWLWLPAEATMVLDEVKRGGNAPPGAMDLLIVTCLQEFRGLARQASLGLAPITGAGYAPRLAVVESFLRTTLGINTLAPGLYSFKAKFNPVWERRYLVVERVVDVPPVLFAMLLLHYPEFPRSLQKIARVRLARI